MDITRGCTYVRRYLRSSKELQARPGLGPFQRLRNTSPNDPRVTEQAEKRAGKLLCDEHICPQATEKRGVCAAESTNTMTSAVTEERTRVLRLSNLPTLAGPIMPLPAVRVSPLLQKPQVQEPECSTALAINVERLLLQSDVSYLWVFFVQIGSQKLSTE